MPVNYATQLSLLQKSKSYVSEAYADPSKVQSSKYRYCPLQGNWFAARIIQYRLGLTPV